MTSGLALPRLSYNRGSFRDPDGRVFHHSGGVYRTLSPQMLDDWTRVSGSGFFPQRIKTGSIVRTDLVSDVESVNLAGPEWAGTLQHERLPFISHPYEWPFGMLQDAAILQLELLLEALQEDLILKDATPYNVQFRGAQPVFIDIGSFTRYVSGSPWTAYRQFCMQFLFPLFLQAYRGLDFHPWLRGSQAGITPSQCRKLFTWVDLWRPGVLMHVLLHDAMDRHVQVEDEGLSSRLRRHGFDKSLILNNIRGLLGVIEGLTWHAPASTWSNYDATGISAGDELSQKEAFVRDCLKHRRWTLVWDLGCNAGRYSRMAAEQADFVVAVDGDHLTVERLYRQLKQESDCRILPLRINLADPSPSQGWRGGERLDLASRGRPELVLCLALLHHLVLGENLLLDDVVDWLASLGCSAVVEFVDRDDPQVRRLLAQRTDAGHEYSQSALETALAGRFRILRRATSSSASRTLYFVEPTESSTVASQMVGNSWCAG